MGYFPVRYDSRVVIYERKMFIRLATGYDLIKKQICCNSNIGKAAQSKQKKARINNYFACLFLVNCIPKGLLNFDIIDELINPNYA